MKSDVKMKPIQELSPEELAAAQEEVVKMDRDMGREKEVRIFIGIFVVVYVLLTIILAFVVLSNLFVFLSRPDAF